MPVRVIHNWAGPQHQHLRTSANYHAGALMMRLDRSVDDPKWGTVDAIWSNNEVGNVTVVHNAGLTPDFWGTCDLMAMCSFALAEVQPRVQAARKIGTREARIEVLKYLTPESLLRYQARWNYSHSEGVENVLQGFVEKERQEEKERREEEKRREEENRQVNNMLCNVKENAMAKLAKLEEGLVKEEKERRKGEKPQEEGAPGKVQDSLDMLTRLAKLEDLFSKLEGDLRKEEEVLKARLSKIEEELRKDDERLNKQEEERMAMVAEELREEVV
ncbi:hypothetical protein PG996_004789 [Apiospora saccharicola]|uniref:Uncharacterized protein n=1 Tax=Apiospora saccharicola TaxID=335842 RepID=A0ABR1W8V8_9PEZI